MSTDFDEFEIYVFYGYTRWNIKKNTLGLEEDKRTSELSKLQHTTLQTESDAEERKSHQTRRRNLQNRLRFM